MALGGLDEHPVMLALDFRQRIAERGAEIRVGGADRAVHVEFDHRLRLPDRVDLAVIVGGLQLLRGDVGCELDDLERLAGLVEDRIVGGEDPDLLAPLPSRLYSAASILAAVQPRPEFAIGGAVAILRHHEHAVVLALDLVERVSDRAEEILVGGDDGAVHVEFDHGLGAADRGDLAGVLHALDLLRGDVGRELDHPDRLSAGIEDRIVGGLDPDFAAALAEALVLRGLEFAAVQPGPEFAIGRALALGRIDEHAVMLALDFGRACNPRASRKFWFAVTMVPSSLNSITACDLLIASACASAFWIFALLCKLNTPGSVLVPKYGTSDCCKSI